MITEYKGVSPDICSTALICPGAFVIGDVKVGSNSSIWYNCVIRGDVNSIYIGKNTNVQDLSVIHVQHVRADVEGSGHGTMIGDDVTIGHACIIHACSVSDRCLIGMGSILMDYSVIDCDSIVGAGSVVTKGKKFEPESLILGNPARFIRRLTKEEIASIKYSSEMYVSLKNSFMGSRG